MQKNLKYATACVIINNIIIYKKFGTGTKKDSPPPIYVGYYYLCVIIDILTNSVHRCERHQELAGQAAKRHGMRVNGQCPYQRAEITRVLRHTFQHLSFARVRQNKPRRVRLGAVQRQERLDDRHDGVAH
jgi:hypothetical protein